MLKRNLVSLPLASKESCEECPVCATTLFKNRSQRTLRAVTAWHRPGRSHVSISSSCAEAYTFSTQQALTNTTPKMLAHDNK